MDRLGLGSGVDFCGRSVTSVIQEQEPIQAETDNSTALWLAQLRWIAIAGQLIVIGFVRLILGIPLAIPQLLTIVLLTIASNIALWVVAKRLGNQIPYSIFFQNRLLGGVLLFDVAILTGLL